ncbi:helix-turn-helix domain-containing protein [Mesorhizobium sp.]|uniref:helix-turn-helix domain-containing protein n=1 Tax=Mesorhizobium sp. TaxID=1871066 RepID=UPI000FE8F718|nr:helix-turn-helix domain-containing protein [Mesorhizobium sp.]RWP16328.1 MAG: cyclic nucleotide-binding domain-containing protein [Mesorhizobium sp.]RWQ26037.1 MAG: cyclic nucleotide-binding domain-containing protein [Mesorhizobium sp.]
MHALVRSGVPFEILSDATSNSSGAAGSAITRPLPVSFFAAGSGIYAQGEKVGGHYQIEFGAVRVYRLLSDGRRQITAFHLAGESFGFEADYTHHFFAEAIVATGLRTFRPTAGVDMSRELLPLALRGMVRAQEHLLVVGRQNAVERIAAFLIDMTDRQGELTQIELPMSRQDIGDYLGLTIETVSRVLSRLRDKGILKFHSLRTLEISKPETLRSICE